MISKFIKVLKNNSKVSAWKITEYLEKSYELFYVQDKLEVNRASDTKEYTVTVYVDKKKQRGASSFNVYDYMSEAEINEKIEENVFAAGFAMNEYYEIPKPEKTKPEKIKSNLGDKPFEKLMPEIVDAVFAANVYKQGYLSATEFFLRENTNRIVNSNGVDITTKKFSGNIEVIPSWDANGEEAEVYRMINFTNFNAKEITAEVDFRLMLAKARCEAKKLTKKSGLKVIIQDAEAGDILRYFSEELTYGKKYTKTLRFDKGAKIQGTKITGDKLNVKVVPFCENAYSSSPVDGDGVVLSEVELIKDGTVKNLHGSYRFGYYLKEKKPTGVVPVLSVAEGKKTSKEMQKEPYLRCVEFSAIQVESDSGYFGGEVRLGYYFDGKKEIPVTGFAISGDLNKSKSTMVFSKETVTTEYYHGPKYIEFKDVQIL